MPSYQGLLDDATRTLFECSETPRIDAELLLQHAINKQLAWLIANGDSEATTSHTKAFIELIKQRFEGKPVAYLLGYRDFWTLRLQVNEHVLIPRPDTETLVEHALERISTTESQRILDLGTGSGAIALALAKERPKSQVIAADKSKAALELAQQNADVNNIKNVSFVVSDWFSKIEAEPQFDLIASNPPYIDAGDSHLEQLTFEPDIALISDENGLGDLRRIIENSRQFIVTGGHLILEHGFNQQEAVAQLLTDNGFHNLSYHKDINQLPRCTSAQWQK